MKNNKWMLLFNPFKKIAGWQAFIIGFPIVLLTVVVGYFNQVCFPGLLSVKVVPGLTLENAFLIQLIGWLPTVLLVWLAGLIFSKGVRFQDVLGTVTLARFPYFFVALLGIIVEPFSEVDLMQSIMDKTFTPVNYFGMFAFGFICLLFSIWTILLLFHAFSISTGLKGKKGILSFIGVVILSEIISIVIFTLL